MILLRQYIFETVTDYYYYYYYYYKKSKATFIQIHSIPYNIHYNPQKHPDSLMEESSMPQNQMEKENLSIF